MTTQPASDAAAKGTKKKSALREWLDSIVFAVVVATFIRWLFIEAYMIPSPSMESSLMVGDYLFVSKMHYGARTPQTPLQIPLTFQKIWGTNIPAYLDWIQIPMFRLPGFSDVERNDPVVFNFPDEIGSPVDMKTYYIKRCVAVAGDALEIKNQQLFINGQPAENPAGMQSSFLVASKQPIANRERVFHDRGIRHVQQVPDPGYFNTGVEPQTPSDQFYLIQSTLERAEALKELNFIYAVEPVVYKPGMTVASRFNRDGLHAWTWDNFGPLTVPKEGMTIEINAETLNHYGQVIQHYEHLNGVSMADGKLSIDGKEVTSYTFTQDYYFMMGDNRHDSSDSRIWGFVPADHIVGKALFTWWSIDDQTPWSEFFEKVRWERIFTLID